MPQPSVREMIVGAVIVALAGINGQAPYQTSVDKVFNFDVSPEDGQNDDIFMGVSVIADTVSTIQTRLSPLYFVPETMMVSIRAYIKDSVDAIEQIKSHLVNDCKRALFAQLNLGILTNAVRITGLDFQREASQPTGTGAIATFLANLTVQWEGDPTNP